MSSILSKALDINNLHKLKAIVVGTGISGQSAVKLLHHYNAKIRILDNNPNALENLPADFLLFIKENQIEIILGEHAKEHFLDFDIVIPSPGAQAAQLIPLFSEENPPQIIAETEFASLFIKEEKILAITGTSGKTTTTSLAKAMLEEHGLKVFMGGNIGTPLSVYILERELKNIKADCILLELSSFQLQNCQSLKPNVAVLLNISENHLDYHKDMQEYIDAKLRIFQSQDDNDFAILGAEFENNLPLLEKIKAKKIFFRISEESSKAFSKSNLFGKHNILNAEAAYQGTKFFGVSLEDAQKALLKFEAIEHRLEKVAEYKNILFVNDSKGTTVESLKVALSAFQREKNPILLLVGGKFKGGDLESLNPLIKEKVKSIIMFGASRKYFEDAWQDLVPMSYEATLEKGMKKHFANASEHDVILLSPATSSFDQYKSYIDRGNDFKAITAQIIAEQKTKD